MDILLALALVLASFFGIGFAILVEIRVRGWDVNGRGVRRTMHQRTAHVPSDVRADLGMIKRRYISLGRNQRRKKSEKCRCTLAAMWAGKPREKKTKELGLVWLGIGEGVEGLERIGVPG
ncbi:hypothetical protein JB92DRAFT_2828684 [Gautieria morchelliformis]|nr:hypothetical protein JB92DRAFT_2828684 [Gautieria morchelliformis]